MTTILLTEVIDRAAIDLLTARAGFRLVVAAPGDPAFVAALPDALGIGVRVARLDRSLLSRAPLLRFAAKHGVGFDNIDVGYLASRDIPVTVTADANSISVAERRDNARGRPSHGGGDGAEHPRRLRRAARSIRHCRPGDRGMKSGPANRIPPHASGGDPGLQPESPSGSEPSGVP